jgi:hypothetical protein
MDGKEGGYSLLGGTVGNLAREFDEDSCLVMPSGWLLCKLI